MITYRSELLYEVCEEAQPLLDMHYQELTLNKDVAKLNPMWERYRALEDGGMFCVFTARDEGKLIGYSAFFIHRHLHDADLMMGMNDVLYLHPDWRKGRIGIKLIQFCEAELAKRGVQKVTWNCKDNGLGVLLKHLGYQHEEVVVAKII